MLNSFKVLIAAAILASACALTARAQSTGEKLSGLHQSLMSEPTEAQAAGPKDYRLKKGDNEWGSWSGVAFQATTIFGGLRAEEARDRKLVIAAFRYGRTFYASENLALQYTLDAIPLAVASGNITRATTVTTPTGTVTTFRRESTYGAGLTPLGLQLDFLNSSRVKPFVHVNGGFLIFTKSVPLPDAGKFALVGEAGTGLRIFTSARRAVSLGVRFHHISNGDRSGSNRGLNEFVIYAGFSIFR